MNIEEIKKKLDNNLFSPLEKCEGQPFWDTITALRVYPEFNEEDVDKHTQSYKLGAAEIGSYSYNSVYFNKSVVDSHLDIFKPTYVEELKRFQKYKEKGITLGLDLKPSERSLEQYDMLIRQARDHAIQVDEDTRDKTYVGQSHWREVSRLMKYRNFVELGVMWEEFREGQIIIEDKFIYALRSDKWRVKGKQKWYRSKGPQDFMERFVMKSQKAS